MDTPVCPAHPDAALSPVIHGARDQFWGFDGSFDYSECATCRGWVLTPRPGPSEIGKFYGGYYTTALLQRLKDKYSRGRRSAGIVGRLRSLGFLKRLYKIGGSLGKGQTMLDVGCGVGGFARWVRDRTGVESRGVDFDPACKAFCEEVHELPVDVGELKGQSYADGQFDCVTAWHVLEHVYDPVDELAEMHRILKPGGWLMIEVPTNDLVGRIFRRRWIYLQPPTHLYHFRPRTLREMLQTAGFEVVSLRRPWFPGEIAASLMMSFGIDGFLKKVFGPNRPVHQKLLTLILFAQMVYDIPVSLFLAAIGRPGLMRVFARKPGSLSEGAADAPDRD